MRAVLAMIVLAACAGGTPAPASPQTPPAPIAGPAPPAPSDADIVKRSHEIIEAFDRGDAAALAAGLAPGFVQFEGGSPQTRDELLAIVKKRKPGVPYIAKRTWDKEKVLQHADHVVFVGKAQEVQGGNETHGGGYLYEGWYMLQWAPVGQAWQLRLWTWQRQSAERDTWNEIYRNGRGFSQEPNKLLVDTIKGQRAGTALDLAMGQGRNAIYLATQGWKVTGVDISDEGLRIAREQAEKRKLPLEAVNANVNDWDFGKNRWDLVTMIYTPANEKWIEKIKPSLRQGGLIVIDGWAKVDDESWGFAPGQLAKLFAGYEILKDEIVEDQPDWAQDRGKLARFVARKR